MFGVIFDDETARSDMGVRLTSLGSGTRTLEPGDTDRVGIVFRESVAIEHKQLIPPVSSSVQSYKFG